MIRVLFDIPHNPGFHRHDEFDPSGYCCTVLVGLSEISLPLVSILSLFWPPPSLLIVIPMQTERHCSPRTNKLAFLQRAQTSCGKPWGPYGVVARVSTPQRRNHIFSDTLLAVDLTWADLCPPFPARELALLQSATVIQACEDMSPL